MALRFACDASQVGAVGVMLIPADAAFESPATC